MGTRSCGRLFRAGSRATIQPGLTVLDWLQQYDPQAGTEELRGLLGQMLFLRDEGMKPTEAFRAARRRD